MNYTEHPDGLERMCRWIESHPKLLDRGLATIIGAALAMCLFSWLSS
jgi:hypothetical protein